MALDVAGIVLRDDLRDCGIDTECGVWPMRVFLETKTCQK